jgi:hypothetical protein
LPAIGLFAIAAVKAAGLKRLESALPPEQMVWAIGQNWLKAVQVVLAWWGQIQRDRPSELAAGLPDRGAQSQSNLQMAWVRSQKPEAWQFSQRIQTQITPRSPVSIV